MIALLIILMMHVGSPGYIGELSSGIGKTTKIFECHKIIVCSQEPMPGKETTTPYYIYTQGNTRLLVLTLKSARAPDEDSDCTTGWYDGFCPSDETVYKTVEALKKLTTLILKTDLKLARCAGSMLRFFCGGSSGRLRNGDFGITERRNLGGTGLTGGVLIYLTWG